MDCVIETVNGVELDIVLGDYRYGFWVTKTINRYCTKLYGFERPAKCFVSLGRLEKDTNINI